MNFTKPSEESVQSHESWVQAEAERMKWRREKFSQRRRASQDGFFDDETALIAKPPRPTRCTTPGHEDRITKAKGLCPACYKRARRATGKTN